jgi:hypothetical protein
MYGDAKEAEQLKRAASSQVPVNRALGSIIGGKDKPSSHVDTTPIVSPFGKSASTTVPTPRYAQPVSPLLTHSPSFASMQATAEMEDELLPKYMQSKLVIKDDASKYQKALDTKPALTVAPRPLHLQHDLNANAPFGNPAPSQPTTAPSQPTTAFDNPFLAPQPQPFDTSNLFLSPPSQSFTPSTNPFF